MSPLRLWLVAARPRTLPAAVAPVLVGTSLAGSEGTFRAAAVRVRADRLVFIQIGTNLSNDYSDARRGADTEDRLGPVRVTAGGLMPPRQVLIGTYVAFGVAVAAGVYLIAVAGWQLLLVGAASILAGVLYTGGPRPYGYEGLGEVFVFLFFGVVAVAGRTSCRPRSCAGRLRAVGAGRAAGRGDPARQQHARHRHRPPRRQADAGGPARPRQGARAVRRHRDLRSSAPVVCVVGGLSPLVLLALPRCRWRRRCVRTVRTRSDGRR